jgi:signal transduction histidine kinase
MTRQLFAFATFIGVTATYIAAGKLGLSMAFLNASASPVWPPTGLALAALLLFGERFWPAVLIGAFVVNLTTAGTVTTSVVIALGNTLEAVIGARMTRRLAGGTAAFDLAPNIFRFTFLAAIPSTMTSATVGVTCLALAKFVRWDLYASVWLTWWTGDLVGDLVVAPLLLIWAARPRLSLMRRSFDPARMLEVLALVIVLIVVGDLVFIRWHLHYGRADAVAYVAVPPLLWAAFRFQQRGAIAATSVLSALAIRGTLRDAGPFATGDVNESLLLLQTFVGVNTLMVLILGAVVAEGKRVHSEREQLLQRERSARAEAEQANQAKDQFLAVLSHELRTPLTPVLLATSLLENNPALPPDLSQQAHMIRRNVELEARLIDDLLDLTRIRKGKLNLNLTTVDVHEVLKRAVEICCAERASDVKLYLGAAWHHVRGDPARLQQVFWNLANNATKFTPTGRPIIFRTSNPNGQKAGESSTVEIEVSDTGIGLEPHSLPRLFNAFEQGDNTANRRFGGLGLGLAITKGLVDAHEGTIIGQSAGRDQGASFTVRLPVAADIPQRQPESMPRADQPWRAAVRVLLVEDHEETLKILAMLLRRLSFDVTTASSIKAALAAAAEKRFDLLISDLGLPDGLGYELMRSLRTTIHVRGIALSGYGMSSDLRLSQEAGFAEHLVKPVDLKVLQDTIARVLAAP